MAFMETVTVPITGRFAQRGVLIHFDTAPIRDGALSGVAARGDLAIGPIPGLYRNIGTLTDPVWEATIVFPEG